MPLSIKIQKKSSIYAYIYQNIQKRALCLYGSIYQNAKDLSSFTPNLALTIQHPFVFSLKQIGRAHV